MTLLKKLAFDFRMNWESHERRIKTCFVCLIIKFRWKRKMKRLGINIDAI